MGDASADGGGRPDEPGGDEHGSPTAGAVAALRSGLRRQRSRAEQLLRRHEDQPLLSLGLRIWDRDKQAAGTLIGSAIAFRLFLFFVPLLLFVVGIAGFLRSILDVEQVEEATGMTGQLSDQIRTALNQPGSTRWLAVFSGAFGMFSAGRSLSKVLTAASSLAWQMPVVTKAVLRVVGAIVGLMTGLALCSTILNRIRLAYGLPVAGVSSLVALCAYVVLWLLVLARLPRPTRDPGALIPGAAIVALVITGLQLVTQLYLPGQLGRASALYGAIGTTVVTLGWFFILGRAIVLGMAVNAVVYERYGSISRVVFALPVVRILPRRSAKVRGYFGLEDEPIIHNG